MCMINCAPELEMILQCWNWELRNLTLLALGLCRILTRRLVSVFARNRSPRTSPHLVSHRDVLTITYSRHPFSLSHRHCSLVSRLRRLLPSIRSKCVQSCHSFCTYLGMFLESTCLSQNSSLFRCVLPFPLPCFALIVSSALALQASLVNEINVQWVVLSLLEFESLARFQVRLDAILCKTGCSAADGSARVMALLPQERLA